ncbi:MAG: DUF296 domain-containing protein [Fretibacterium sp.]|nr:DUF296 domain-containing protein [Fretibacterium sp.]
MERNRVFCASSARFFSFRLLPGDDLLIELWRWISEVGLRAGYVAGVVGSLSQAGLRFAGRPETTVLSGCFEVVSLTGTLDANGEHLHMTLSDSEGRVTGGHVMEGCLVRTTMELVVGLLEDVVFDRKPCPFSGYDELRVRSAL